MARKNAELLKTLLLVAFLAGGLLLVRIGALPAWAWIVLTLVTIGMRILARLDAYTDELAIGEAGITRTHGSKMRKQLTEAVSWQELEKVEVLARETGPDMSEPLFLLHGQGENGVAVPGELAQEHALVARLRERLPGLREDRLAQALAASESGAFTVWEKDAA